MALRLLIAGMLLAAILPGPCRADADAFDSKALSAVARTVADQVLRGIRNVGDRNAAPLRVAIRPFRPDETDLPDDVAANLNDALEAAVVEAGGGAVTLITRENLREVWAEAGEFRNADLPGLVHNAGADVLMTGRIDPTSTGVLLSYKAIDVRLGRAGQTLGMTAQPQALVLRRDAIGVRPLDQALRGGARELARRLAGVGAITGGETRFQQTGESTRFGDYALKHFLDELQTQLPEAARRNSGQQSVTGEAAVAPAPAMIRLAATVMELDTWVEIEFSVQTPDGAAIASRMVRIQKSSIPESFLPLDRGPRGTLRATGEALLSERFDADAARRAASALARARVIAQARGDTLAGAPTMATDLVEGAWALQAITGGITYDELWSFSSLDGGKRVRAALQARAEKLGNGEPGVPAVQAALSSSVVKSMKPFSLTLRADRPAAVAIFGWSSDDRVVRLYPYAGQRMVRVTAERPLTLPRPGEPPFVAAPRLGLVSDLEALIVVASREPLDYERLAPEAAASAQESLARAVPIQNFFASLAEHAPREIGMNVLPYQIVTGEK